jgi:hypothetical protein
MNSVALRLSLFRRGFSGLGRPVTRFRVGPADRGYKECRVAGYNRLRLPGAEAKFDATLGPRYSCGTPPTCLT